jgi:hypothetical protein
VTVTFLISVRTKGPACEARVNKGFRRIDLCERDLETYTDVCNVHYAQNRGARESVGRNGHREVLEEIATSAGLPELRGERARVEDGAEGFTHVPTGSLEAVLEVDGHCNVLGRRERGLGSKGQRD